MEWKGFALGLIITLVVVGGIFFLFNNSQSSSQTNLQNTENNIQNSQSNTPKEYNLNELKADCGNNPSVCYTCNNESGGLTISSIPVTDSTYCEKQCLDHPTNCYTKLALGTKKVDYCHKIIYQGGADFRSFCYFKLAIQEKDPSICNFITDDSNSQGTAEYKQSCINSAK